MKDMIPKGTGNSRFLRSVSNFKAIYSTYDDFVNALVAGNLPVDFNGINEAGIQQVGTPLSKANLLTDETAAALGLEQENPTINDAFGVLGVVRKKHEKIASYETAGSYQWTAPDLVDGKAYKIGVLIIGGGGSGGMITFSTSLMRRALGGAAGYSETMVMVVLPGETKSLVVGAGGQKVTSSAGGNAGGTSSFSGVTADGGSGGKNSKDVDAVSGSAPATISGSCYGLQKLNDYDYAGYGVPTQRINLFECKPMLGGGGSAATTSSGSGSTSPAGKNPITGLGGGAAAVSTSGTAYAENATEAGCGGGGAIRKDGSSGSSGAGADGAVYIYFLGVADE